MNRYNLAVIGVTLAAGLLIGFAATLFAVRRQWMRIPGEGAVHRMDRILKLTPAQREQVRAVIDETRDKVYQLHRDCRRRRRELVDQGRSQIRALLTPAQQSDFDRYFALKEMPHGGHHGP